MDTKIEIKYEYATLVCRVIGTSIDGVIVLTLFLFTLVVLNRFNINNAYTVISAIIVFYIIYFTWPVSKYGYTPGYKIMNMKIINKNGSYLGIVASFFRYVTKTILGVVSFVSYGTKERQCLHDKLVNSIVIKET